MMAGHSHTPLPPPTPERKAWTKVMARKVRAAVEKVIEDVRLAHYDEVEAVEDVQWERAVLHALAQVTSDVTENLNDGIAYLENGEV